MQHKLRLVKNPSVVEGWEGPKTITKLIHDAYNTNINISADQQSKIFIKNNAHCAFIHFSHHFTSLISCIYYPSLNTTLLPSAVFSTVVL